MGIDQSTNTPESIQVEAHLSRLNILVEDMKRAASFYSLLGFDFSDWDGEVGYVEVRTPDNFRLSLYERACLEEFVPTQPTSGYRVELAFRCPGREGVDAIHQRIVDAGYTSVKAPFDSPWGQRYAFLEDSDGNLVGLEEHALPK